MLCSFTENYPVDFKLIDKINEAKPNRKNAVVAFPVAVPASELKEASQLLSAYDDTIPEA